MSSFSQIVNLKFLDDFLRGFMELHIIFFILAGLLIAVLIGSSILSNRREKSRIFSNTFSQRPPSSPIHSQQMLSDDRHFDLQEQTQERVNQAEIDIPSSVEIQRDVENSLSEIKIRIPGQEADNNTTPEFIRSEVSTYGQPQQTVYESQPERPIFVNTTEITQKYENDYVDNSVATSPIYEQPVQEVVVEAPTQSEQGIPADIITLYVVSAEGYQFEGEHVVQCLEALGFEYGEYNIFHRHKHLGNNNSPVIFSVANMMQPGVFDLNNLKDFSTIGLVIFMHLPTDGNPQTNLRLMLQSTERLASALNGFVLNDRREIFDENSRIEYLKRVS